MAERAPPPRPARPGSWDSSVCSPRSRLLFVEPQPRQVLIDEMGGRDLEALEIGAVRHDAVPPQGPDLMRLFVEDVFLQLAHQLALPRRIGLAQHLVVKRDFGGVLVMSVILGRDRGRQYLLHIEWRSERDPGARLAAN